VLSYSYSELYLIFHLFFSREQGLDVVCDLVVVLPTASKGWGRGKISPKHTPKSGPGVKNKSSTKDGAPEEARHILYCTNASPLHHGGAVPALLPSGGPKS